ncbi:transferrin-binding protein-like solute binding protein [Pelagibacterium halotolerans]|uniref:transferrin-binding protein-like solute binding protein n=1 Tax=Pelagibacterium halotolerans TaxID=531813 RepID=UPI00384C9C82
MTHFRSLTLSVFASMALAGCSFMSGGGGTTDVYDALASGMSARSVGKVGNLVGAGPAEVSMTRSGSLIEVGVNGEVYELPGTSQTPFTNPQWVNRQEYIDYRFAGGADSASLIAGQYMAIAGVEDGVTGDIYLMHGGVETPTSGLPLLSAIYEGAWEVRHADGDPTDSGVFAAAADFDAGSMNIDIQNSSGSTVGSGAGGISGNAFATNFDVNISGSPSNNELAGKFYGPTGQEMAGVIEGEEVFGGNPTYGVLYGHQR